MAKVMIPIHKVFKESSYWFKLAICANIHIKKALLRVLHNNINEPTIKGCPSDPEDLYLFLQNNKNKIQASQHIKKEQKLILLPNCTKSVVSSSLDISLIRYLIQSFCHIKNANKKWGDPDPSDKTICAFVHRAANIRNTIFHYNNIEKLDETQFEEIWKSIKDILSGLEYSDDIEAIKTFEIQDPTLLQGEILQEFRNHLESYRYECSTKVIDDFYIERRFSVYEDENIVFTKIGEILEQNKRVMIIGDAGIGKSTTARHIKRDWSKGKILKEFHLLYFDSKRINQRIQYHSCAAPLFFSELGDHLRKKGKNEMDFIFYHCVKTKIDNLIILIDGIDELPIKEIFTKSYVDELETKIVNNEEISATETVIAIYFGFLFPYSKICLLGRTCEFEQLKKINDKRDTSIFKLTNGTFKDLKLLKFNDTNVKDLTCYKICKKQLNGQTKCTKTCQKIYDKIKNIELFKTPTDLNSIIELHKRHPNRDIGRITRTKLIIASLLNRLNEHIYLKNPMTFKTFQGILQHKEMSNYLECIRTIGKISFDAISKGRVTIKVKKGTDGTIYLNDQDEINIERNILEELDFFYVRDFDYYFLLEPYHTLNIEFLSSCYLFTNPREWSLLLELNMDRQLVIISFIAGLHANDNFTEDFVRNVLNTSDYLVDRFFSWLYDVEHVRKSLPNGGYGYDCWYGLMENEKLSPSLYLLEFVSNEVDIPRTFIPPTIVCYCDYHFSFEWHDMDYFKHSILTKCFDTLNMDSFLDKFLEYNFIIKGYIWINDNHDLDRMIQYDKNDRVLFKMGDLHINTSLHTVFSSSFNLDSLHKKRECETHKVNVFSKSILPNNTITSSSSVCIHVQCKRLDINNITHFNDQQTENLFKNCSANLVDYITLREKFFTDQQIEILKNVESIYTNEFINIELYNVAFDQIFKLPNIGSRHISLNNVDKVNDDILIEFAKHIAPGYHHNLSSYKVIFPSVPFVRKNDNLQKCEQSMYLHLLGVDFRQVSPEVFARTFSLIPSIACNDDDYVPSSHWQSLSRTKDCHINEMRIWEPKSANFEYFLGINTNIQFVCKSKDDLISLLNYIMNFQSVNLDKEMRIFVVKFGRYDCDYDEDITLFDGTIKEFKENFISFEFIQTPFIEREQRLDNWCCDISSSKKNEVSPIRVIEEDIIEYPDYNSWCFCCFKAL